MTSLLHSVQRQVRLDLLLLGLLAVSAGGILVASASQTTLLVTEGELSRFWRTSYDILVRPAGAHSPIEEKYGLVEANHLSGLWGGITFEQYEMIKSIPDVEFAAPIAMIGYIVGGASGEEMPYPPQPGLYALDETITVDDGVRLRTLPDFPSRTYYYFDRNPQQPPKDFKGYRYLDWLIVDDISTSARGMVSFPLLLAGIDPAQEALLTRLDQAIRAGQYLRSDESLEPQTTIISIDEGIDAPHVEIPQKRMSLPVLINATTYISATDQAILSRVTLPPDISSVQDVLDRGASYLDMLPTETLNSTQMDSPELYRRMIETIAPEFVGSAQWAGVFFNQGIFESPGGLVYREGAAPFEYKGLMLELQPSGRLDPTWPQYRASVGRVDFNLLFEWNPVGLFDIERLLRPAEIHSVPLETYFPPVALLRYDERGNPVNPPRELRPTLNPAGYIQPPPLILTTLEAARALRGDEAISAIRVRVADIDELTPQAQRKIEAVAIEIAKQTGLTVDIMVGSSPTRVLVHVPGIGYVEEQWIQKGVNLVYTQGIQTGNWLLLMTLLVAGGVYTLDLTWAEVVARRRLIALQKALGWRSRTVFAHTLGQVLRLGAAAVVVGTLGALGIIRLLNWQSPPDWLLLGLPLAVLGIAALGCLAPAWLASRVPPIVELQRGGLRSRRRRKSGPALGLWTYAGSNLMRRPGRALLTGLTATLSAALLVLLLAATLDQRGMLSGTLLGEFLLVRIERFHYATAGIGLVLAALSTANGLLGSIVERRREIGVLKATGWRTRTVAGLFVREGTLLGLAGGALGALLGSLAYLYLYQSVSPGLTLAILVGAGVPGLVGALAALYPAQVAAEVPPTEALRYE
ncbi:MAG TPA: FtsX-like permease family protein [Anaerolineae bacterium]